MSVIVLTLCSNSADKFDNTVLCCTVHNGEFCELARIKSGGMFSESRVFLIDINFKLSIFFEDV